MTRRAVKIAYEEAGVRPEDVAVVELHDCFSANEVDYILVMMLYMIYLF